MNMREMISEKTKRYHEVQDQLLEETDADFETALAATGFGKLNLFLIFLTIPASWSALFETSTMSFVFPAAQCALDLSLDDKGMLNAITFGGNVISLFIWGYFFDSFGRRKLLVILYSLDAICVLTSGFITSKEILIINKLVGGFLISGPFIGIATYLSELQVVKFRTRMPLFLGVGFSLGCIYLPLMAALILPLNFELTITNDWVIHSWGLFLFISAIPSTLCGIVFMFLPESPRFLMANGRNVEALEVFKRMYSINNNESPENYPIKKLIQETETKEHLGRDSDFSFKGLKRGFNRIGPLFRYPHLKNFILVCILNGFATTSLSTLLLWMPQLFQAVSDFKFLNNGTSSSLCIMLDVIRPSPKEEARECFVKYDNLEVYFNSAAVGLTSLTGFFIASTIINSVGQKRLLNILTFVSGWAVIGIYFSQNEQYLTVLFAIYKTVGSVTANVAMVIMVNLFPTSLRAMTVALVSTFGTIATMIGNIIFPTLIKAGCAPPFVSIAVLLFTSFILSLFLPKERKSLA